MQEQSKRTRFFVRPAVIGRRHAPRSLLARMYGPRAACIDSAPSRFDLQNPLNSTDWMTGKPEVMAQIRSIGITPGLPTIREWVH